MASSNARSEIDEEIREAGRELFEFLRLFAIAEIDADNHVCQCRQPMTVIERPERPRGEHGYAKAARYSSLNPS